MFLKTSTSFHIMWAFWEVYTSVCMLHLEKCIHFFFLWNVTYLTFYKNWKLFSFQGFSYQMYLITLTVTSKDFPFQLECHTYTCHFIIKNVLLKTLHDVKRLNTFFLWNVTIIKKVHFSKRFKSKFRDKIPQHWRHTFSKVLPFLWNITNINYEIFTN